ncbi:transposase family protein [Nonomuraea sp. NPDC003201]
MSSDEADIWSVLVSSLSAGDDGSDGGQGDDLALDTTVVDLVDHFAVIDDPRHPSWVVHPLAAVLVLCAAAVVAGMRGLTAIAGWVTDTPPPMLAMVYSRCGKPPLVPSKSTIWQVGHPRRRGCGGRRCGPVAGGEGGHRRRDRRR